MRPQFDVCSIATFYLGMFVCLLALDVVIAVVAGVVWLVSG